MSNPVSGQKLPFLEHCTWALLVKLEDNSRPHVKRALALIIVFMALDYLVQRNSTYYLGLKTGQFGPKKPKTILNL